jgi:hypothetical protein
VVSACFKPAPPSGAPCSSVSTCPDGLACIAGLCVTPGGGAPDAPVGGDAQRDAAAHSDGARDAVVDAPAATATFVQSSSGFGQPWNALGSTVTVELATPARPGDLLVVFVSHDDRGQAVTLTDDGGDAFTPLDSKDDVLESQTGLDAFAIVGASGTRSVTVSLAKPACCRLASVFELSGAASVAPIDAHAGNLQAPAPTTIDGVTSGDATTTAAGEVVLGISSDSLGSGGQIIRDAANTTSLENVTGTVTGGGALASELFISGAIGPVSSQFTYANGADRAITLELAIRAAE